MSVIKPLSTFYRYGYFLTKPIRTLCQSSHGECSVENLTNLIDDDTSSMLPRSIRLSGMPHQVYVVHPSIKWGPNKTTHINPKVQLSEAASLVHTLPNWKVVGTDAVNLVSFDKKYFFNKGRLQQLKDDIAQNPLITALFLNVQMLKIIQQVHLEEILNVPVFDRYKIIINIFKHHARTKEAKLQVALAEIPYIYSRLRGETDDDVNPLSIGAGTVFMQKRLELLKERELKIKKSIKDLREGRELLRNKRTKLKLPVVAVVGYTNAGKTSLIKKLTGDSSMMPENKLFATLDVTFHAGMLPSNLKVLFVDTIGFISDIPSKLLEPFVATLEDAIYADVILHVKDVSHPHRQLQSNVVINTLQSFKLDSEMLNNIVSVNNKCDLVDSSQISQEGLMVSCTENIGIEDLKAQLETAVIKATGLKKLQIRVKTGSQEYTWLYKEASVSKVSPDQGNLQYSFMSVLITPSKLEQFKHYFIYRNVNS